MVETREGRVVSIRDGKELDVWTGPEQVIPGTEPDVEIDERELPGEWNEVYWIAPTGGLSWEQYEKLVAIKRHVRNQREKKLNTDLWQLADILNWGLMEFGESFYQLFEGGHYKQESLANIARIGEAFDVERRWSPDAISFWTHGDVYTLDPIDADELLEQYAAGELTRGELRDEVRLLREGKSPGASGGGSDDKKSHQHSLLDTCPLCDGLGEVTPDRREAYLMEEATTR